MSGCFCLRNSSVVLVSVITVGVQWVFLMLFFLLHILRCCWAMPMSDFHIMWRLFKKSFLTQLFSYVHIPTHRHTDSHTGSYIHLRTHMVAFIVSTPQSASCGTSCLDWERGGPETNRISRGAWTATVLMGTLIQDGVTQKFRGKTINSNLLLLHLHRSLLYPNAYISFFAFRSPFPLQILTSLVTPC